MEIHLWRELLIPYELAVKELVIKFNHLKKEHKEKDLYSPLNKSAEESKRSTVFWKKCREKIYPGQTWRRRWKILPASG